MVVMEVVQRSRYQIPVNKGKIENDEAQKPIA